VSEHLELILEDLKTGLRRRAERRRRVRTAGASLATSAALAAMAFSTFGLIDRAPAAVASDGNVAAQLIAGGCGNAEPGLVCWSPARN
jgi:hypothetical protein